MTAITIIQSSVFISYVGYLLIEFKKPLPSISDSWYELPEPERHLFTLFCWSIGVLMFFQTDGSTGWFFLSGAGLCFTGAATRFEDEMTSDVHYVGAVTAIVSALLGLSIERELIWPIVLFGLSFPLLSMVNNRTWWIEITAFVLIIIGLS